MGWLAVALLAFIVTFLATHSPPSLDIAVGATALKIDLERPRGKGSLHQSSKPARRRGLPMRTTLRSGIGAGETKEGEGGEEERRALFLH